MSYNQQRDLAKRLDAIEAAVKQSSDLRASEQEQIAGLADRISALEATVKTFRSDLLADAHASVLATVNAAMDSVKKDLKALVHDHVHAAVASNVPVNVPEVLAVLSDSGADRQVVSE